MPCYYLDMGVPVDGRSRGKAKIITMYFGASHLRYSTGTLGSDYQRESASWLLTICGLLIIRAPDCPDPDCLHTASVLRMSPRDHEMTLLVMRADRHQPKEGQPSGFFNLICCGQFMHHCCPYFLSLRRDRPASGHLQHRTVGKYHVLNQLS